MKPAAPPVVPDRVLTDAALLAMTREQLYDLLRQVPQTSVPGLFRATDDALRNACKTYLRMGRLTPAQVLTAKGKL